MVGFHDATRLATLHNSAMPGPLTPRHKGTVYGDDDISIFSHLLSIYLSIYLYLSIYRCLWPCSLVPWSSPPEIREVAGGAPTLS